MRPLHIAFIGQRGVPATFGGIEHHVEEIGSRLVARGHQVTVYTRPGYTTERVSSYRGMRVRYIPTVGTKHLEALVHSGLSTAAAMAPGRGHPDILHYHAIGPSIFTPLPRLLTRRGVVLTLHGLDYERDKWGTGAKLALRGAGWVSSHVPQVTISVSQNLAAYYLERYGRRAHYIPNGVSAPTPTTPRLIRERFGLGEQTYLLFLGRLVPEKAPDLLLQAFSGLRTDLRLVLAGGSSFTDSYVRQLEATAAQDPRVIMTGPVYGEVLAELYTNAAAFVLPSRLEGLPLTLLEAASYRIPVITSDIAPHREVIRESSAGARMFRRDDASDLRNALSAVLDTMPAARADAASFGERVVSEYDWGGAAAATEEVYAEVLRQRGDRSHTDS